MILPSPKDAIHKAWMFRLLSAIADNTLLVEHLRFKGGTCAAMRELIPRFSVDLDFDLLDSGKVNLVKENLEVIFKELGLVITEQSKVVPQYFLKYANLPHERSSLKVDITFPPPKSNDYEPVRFMEIDRILYAQTIPTMFANKLVTIFDRFERYGSVAGRDLFDVHIFFLRGFSYKPEIIEERTGLREKKFFSTLTAFIRKHFTQTVIDQDLNTLLPLADFRKIRKTLKQEVLIFLMDR